MFLTNRGFSCPLSPSPLPAKNGAPIRWRRCFISGVRPSIQVPADERAKLVQELLELIRGKVMDIALKHDASRVVQTALQFGNREVRNVGP